MCGIAGIFQRGGAPVQELRARLERMNSLQKHRGPDGDGVWTAPGEFAGVAHVRLSIIDISGGAQPMLEPEGQLAITFNGEIYNYKELRTALAKKYVFRTNSDTEVILRAYREWGESCVERLRGMFAFAIWDGARRRLFLARDRFGIKPLYFAEIGDTVYFASEIKTLLPFLPERRISRAALREYLTFQFCLLGKTLFAEIKEIPPAHHAVIDAAGVRQARYWKVNYELDCEHDDAWFRQRCLELVEDSVKAHIVSDVPVGAYLSGGIDSSALAILARRAGGGKFMAFHGRFDNGPRYDESAYARKVAEAEGMELREITIRPPDFPAVFDKVIYHLDNPVAGPGSIPQYLVSQLVKGSRKTVLGGQGGDEIFGGYVRYLVAYFEQCFKGAIRGVDDPGRFVVTYESIIPNLRALQGYEPMLRNFFAQGMFEEYDRRYYRLVNRAGDLGAAVEWEALGDYDPYQSFREVYFSNEIGQRCYFDSMLHFDFVTLLPALLQVEDRMSMAHGIESRTPFLDHPLVEFAATVPGRIKFKNGELKRLLIRALGGVLPPELLARKDKMGFPVPLTEWFRNELREFVRERFENPSPAAAEFLNYAEIRRCLVGEEAFGRKVWGLLCLDSFFRQFIDN